MLFFINNQNNINTTCVNKANEIQMKEISQNWIMVENVSSKEKI